MRGSNRRAFLINGARVAGGLVLASCASGVPGTQSAANVPVSKDLVIGAVTEILTGQPFNNGGGQTIGQVFNGLYDPVPRRGNDYKLEAGLATSWKALDPVTWQFKLRPGVKWHDGVPFTSDDLLFTVNVSQDKDVTGFRAAGFASGMRSAPCT